MDVQSFFSLVSNFRRRARRPLAVLATAVALVLATGAPTYAVEPGVAAHQVQTVNINRASAEEFTALDGVGESKAQAIVEHRDINGAFASVDQLTEVKGIGPATVEKNRARLSL